MKRLKLSLPKDDQIKEIHFQMRRMVNAGYTGRDQEAVKKHIEQLKKEGIPLPGLTPTVYEMNTQLIYFDDEMEEIEVVGNKTSGEAEFILLYDGKEVYVGVGSDHTDRELEVTSIIKSKQICPNLMSRRIWLLKDVRKDWDELMLRSWVKNDEGLKGLYQEASLSSMMTPEDLMAFVQGEMDDKNLEGVVIYSGTIPTLTTGANYNNYFEVELSNPKTGKKLHCSYKVRVLDYLRGRE